MKVMSKTYNVLTTNSVGMEKRCPVCKKTFFTHSQEHAYRIPGPNGMRIPVCSWSCMRADEKKRTGKSEAARMRKIENQLKGGL